MSNIVTLGEIMLRLSPRDNLRVVQSNEFDVCYGGGEANVAVSLSAFGHKTYFVSKVVKNEIGEACLRSLLAHGVNIDYIARGGNRLGIYYLETGTSLRPSKVIYDRANSSIAESTINDFDFSTIFKDKNWFHFSGITPALSDSCAKITELALIEAKKAGLIVSVDLNYRKKLWTSEKAISVMRPLMKYVDVCIGNEEDADLVLGFKAHGVDVNKGTLDKNAYHEIFKEMKKEFGFKVIASTLRESFSATHNGWSAVMLSDDKFYVSNHYDINPIYDRVGGGDSFSAGLIHGLLTLSDKDALEFAVAASALKHTILGDFNEASIEEINSLVKGNTSGRVVR
ncbi:MAG: sugar kinase [Acholeplasmatales bacterium]|jgi:2-dehydro-3-deoxygluconokinase|nr:sugar kinase [Acholeplasmatales bacterium]